MNSLQCKSRFKYFANGIQLLAFNTRIGFHTIENMTTPKGWNSFACAYYCRDLLPRDLILEEILKYDRPLIT